MILGGKIVKPGQETRPLKIGTLTLTGIVGTGSLVWYCCTPQPVRPPAPVEPAPDVWVMPEAGPEPEPDAAPEPPPDAAPRPPVECLAERAQPRSRSAKRPVPRVVGGNEALPGAYPFSVAISYRYAGQIKQYCGGSVVAARWVLTAAHCTVAPGDLAVVGRHDLRTDAGSEIRVMAALSHAYYDPDTHDYDIALLELETDAGTPALPLAAEDIDVPLTVAIGWGAMSEGGPSSPVLREVVVPLLDRDYCDEHTSGFTPRMLCAGYPSGGLDLCQGDSGGPLLAWTGAQWIQLGITSFGSGCARPDAPGYYARLPGELTDWAYACMLGAS